MDKQLSIIIPHFNSISLLSQLLESIPDNDWIQVIVVDDNSPISLTPLKLTYPHVDFFKNPIDKKGAGAARNTGLNEAKGKWLIFADSDDYFTNSAFQIIKSHLNNSNADVIYFKPDSFNIGLKRPGTRHKHYANLLNSFSVTKDKTLLYKFFVPWSKMVSRQLIVKHQIEFDEIIASNDMNFSLKVAYFSTRSIYDKNTVYIVTESENSLTKQTSEEVIDSRFYAICRYNQFLEEQNQSKHKLSTNMIIYGARHVGLKKMIFLFVYSIKNKQPLLKGLKPLLKLMFRDLKRTLTS